MTAGLSFHEEMVGAWSPDTSPDAGDLQQYIDADDQEITRTRKVRRGFVGEKYAALIDALYSESDVVKVEAQVTYEDGRTATVRADVRIRDAETFAAPSKA